MRKILLGFGTLISGSCFMLGLGLVAGVLFLKLPPTLAIFGIGSAIFMGYAFIFIGLAFTAGNDRYSKIRGELISVLVKSGTISMKTKNVEENEVQKNE